MNDFTLDRRRLLALAALTSAAGIAGPLSARAEEPAPQPNYMTVPEDAPRITMLVHPRMVMLDLIGPMTVFNILRTHIDLVWKDTAPVSTELGQFITPTKSFLEADETPDVLFVPGGLAGTVACMNDPEVMGFLRDRGERAGWVTGICTGVLTLAAAGLLEGYDATANWVQADLLPLMGARHVNRRVVTDRNRMTGAGVTAGFDFGLELAAKLRGEAEARRVQLIMEYAPEPPFDGGTPAKEPEQAVALRSRMVRMREQVELASKAAGERLGI